MDHVRHEIVQGLVGVHGDPELHEVVGATAFPSLAIASSSCLG